MKTYSNDSGLGKKNLETHADQHILLDHYACIDGRNSGCHESMEEYSNAGGIVND